MKENSVGWFEIYVEDMSRAQKFYESVFLWKLEEMEMPEDFPEIEMLSFSCDYEKYWASWALVKMKEFTPWARWTLIYFSCDDCSV